VSAAVAQQALTDAAVAAEQSPDTFSSKKGKEREESSDLL
jgi:hypothetical protein